MSRTLLLLGALGAAAWATVDAITAATVAAPPADADIPGTAMAAAALLLCSSFFSGSETALFSLQPLDRKAMVGEQVEGAPPTAVETLLTRPRRTLASLLIGNEFINVLLSTVTAGLVLTLAPDKPWLNVVIVTPLLLLFGEVLPKTLALRFNRRVAGIVARPLLLFSRLVTPLRVVLTGIADVFLRLTGGSGASTSAALREAQLLQLIEQGRRSGAVAAMEEEMIQKVFEFGDLTVSRLMTPRPDMFTVGLTMPWDELLAAIREGAHSRVPIYQGKSDNIIGVLVVKDLLPHLASQLRESDTDARDPRQLGLSPRQLQKILHPAHFVPTSKRAEDMLAEFREQKFHMSIVVDEHGNVAGLVTMDDLLAELVGELLDEGDELSPEVTEVVEGVYTLRGQMDIDDFEERFGIALPAGEYDTVAGFLLDQAGTVPAKGAEFHWNGLLFTVRSLEGRRITEVNVQFENGAGPVRGGGEAR
ncbi:MAG: HlyC/CorC family transporter [Alphaproteobacteria bacterium]|nr:HlyC/CorC family transporter [Alphaproteobacteria bacterium]